MSSHRRSVRVASGELGDLRIHRRVCRLVARLGDDLHLGSFDPGSRPLDEVGSEIVVLGQDRDGQRFVAFRKKVPERLALAEVVGAQPIVYGLASRSLLNSLLPDWTKTCGISSAVGSA